MNKELENKVIDAIAYHMHYPGSNISLDSTPDDLFLDSLDEIEIVMILEEEFDIIIRDDELDNINSVRDIVELVSSKVR